MSVSRPLPPRVLRRRRRRQRALDPSPAVVAGDPPARPVVVRSNATTCACCAGRRRHGCSGHGRALPACGRSAAPSSALVAAAAPRTRSCTCAWRSGTEGGATRRRPWSRQAAATAATCTTWAPTTRRRGPAGPAARASPRGPSPGAAWSRASAGGAAGRLRRPSGLPARVGLLGAPTRISSAGSTTGPVARQRSRAGRWWGAGAARGLPRALGIPRRCGPARPVPALRHVAGRLPAARPGRLRLCPEQGANKALLALGVLAVVAGAAGIVYLSIRAEEGVVEVSEAVKKIGLNYLQVVSIAAVFPMRWPPALQSFFEAQAAISSASKSLLSPACELTCRRPAFTRSTGFALPVVVVSLCVAFWAGTPHVPTRCPAGVAGQQQGGSGGAWRARCGQARGLARGQARRSHWPASGKPGAEAEAARGKSKGRCGVPTPTSPSPPPTPNAPPARPAPAPGPGCCRSPLGTDLCCRASCCCISPTPLS